MNTRHWSGRAALACATVAILASCAQVQQLRGGDASASSGTAAKPAADASQPKVPPGMNAAGEVVNSKEVTAGSGQKVKGMGDWEGEITGKPGPESKFTQLQIGMPMQQVVNLLGQPSDQGAYMTGKAWIPFYFGSDRHRYEMVYKGQGRLIFAGGSIGNFTGGNLIWIIHNGREEGMR